MPLDDDNGMLKPMMVGTEIDVTQCPAVAIADSLLRHPLVASYSRPPRTQHALAAGADHAPRQTTCGATA